MTAGAVGTIVISPTPVAPRGPLIRGVSRMTVSISKEWPIVGNLKVTQSLVCPSMILLSQGEADPHIHASFELSFQILRVDDPARIHGRRHLDHPDLSGLRIDLDLRQLDGVDLRFEGRALSGLRVQRPASSFFFVPM